MKRTKKAILFSLSSETETILRALATETGLKMTAIVEKGILLMDKTIRSEGIKLAAK